MKAGTHCNRHRLTARGTCRGRNLEKQAQVFLVRLLQHPIAKRSLGPLQGLAYRDLVVHERLKSLLVHRRTVGAMMKSVRKSDSPIST